jgi:hypothetical protein
VVLPEPAAEAGVRDEAEPALADECSADEALGLLGREPEEDLVDEIVRQRRRRHDERWRRREGLVDRDSREAKR